LAIPKAKVLRLCSEFPVFVFSVRDLFCWL
jgi:hypothetical protein